MTVITEHTIRELAEFRGQDAPVVSCYLDVDGRRLIRGHDIDNELDRLLRSARARNLDSEADLARIESYVRAGIDRSQTRGLAIFSCAAEDLWKVIPLPVSVTSQIVVNASPAVSQLESIVQELEPIGVLLVDRQQARMFVFGFGQLIERSELFEEAPRDIDTRGQSDQGRDRDGQHIEELVAQHLRKSADVAFKVWQEHPFEHLVISAQSESLPIVKQALHPYLSERLAEPVDLPITASVDDVRRTVGEVAAVLERQREAVRIERLRQELGRDGRAVAGLEGTLDALNTKRVEVLFVSNGFEAVGWRGEDGSLYRKGPTSPIDGRALERLDNVVEEAVDLAIASSCTVDICVDNADLDVLGRIGALLRY